MKLSQSTLGLVAFLALASVLSGCGSSGSTPGDNGPGGPSASNDGGSVDVKGSSFVKPFLDNVFADYAQTSKFTVNYAGGGSGAGIQALIDGTVPFACSDAPMNDDETAKAKSGKPGEVLHVPIVLGTVAVVYNLPDVTAQLKFDAATLSAIFQGKVTKWNDPMIVALNAGVTLPDLPIAPVVRADSSGTTYVFTDYLSAADAGWKSTLGVGKEVSWPNTVRREQKNDGVAKGIKDTPGGIGYIELSYSKEGKIPYALIKNADGQFVAPEPEGATAAADKTPLPEGMKGSIVNGPGATTYPISSYVFALLPADMSKDANGAKVVDAIKYVVTTGQSKAAELYYAPLPKSVQDKATAQLAKIKVK
ncbi:MAG: phosphate ABC transporter substrate-binding protein PstS [Armatimonadetes bacterium]|nr:phosphate ABC transporter substrate-binding protein PstS [Armatimonadota bacterium]